MDMKQLNSYEHSWNRLFENAWKSLINNEVSMVLVSYSIICNLNDYNHRIKDPSCLIIQKLIECLGMHYNSACLF